jgi:hypothetical protein
MNAVIAVLLLQAAAAAPQPLLRPVVVTVRDASKAPVKGAKVLADSGTPAERAFAETIAKRAGASKEDGLLDLGALPIDQPIALRIGAPGFRAGSLKLPAGFEAGRRDVVIAPNQDVEVRVSGFAGRKGEARPDITLARCRVQRARSNCNPMEGKTQRLDDEGRARFPRIQGGFYNVSLAAPGVGSTRETVEVASDGDLPVLIVELAVGEWTLRGMTRLHDGTPRPARVKAMEFVNGVGEGTAAECASAADGTFELRVISKAGNMIGLKAESEEPHAVTNSTNPIKLGDAARTVEDILVELDATTLEVTVRDSRSGDPLSGCTVQVEWSKDGDTSYRGSQLTTNEKGIAREYALSGGTVQASVTCKGHYSKDLGTVAIARDQLKQVEMVLDPSKEIILAAADESGRPVAGARALVLAGPLVSYMGIGMSGSVLRLGPTDDTGELRLDGERCGGHPIFIVSPGAAIAIARVPTPSSCDRTEDCRLPVSLRRPSPFAGLTLKNESGRPLLPSYFTILRDGIPVASQVLAAALAANGLPVDASAWPLDVRAAAFLPEGTYAVTTPRAAPDPKTGKDVFRSALVGTFTVPSLERVELVDHDGAPQKP